MSRTAARRSARHLSEGHGSIGAGWWRARSRLTGLSLSLPEGFAVVLGGMRWRRHSGTAEDRGADCRLQESARLGFVVLSLCEVCQRASGKCGERDAP